MMSFIDKLNALIPSATAPSYEETWELLRTRVTVLSNRVWEGRNSWPEVLAWLENFDGRSGLDVELERLRALFIISQFLFIGSKETRVLLQSIYRDLAGGGQSREYWSRVFSYYFELWLATTVIEAIRNYKAVSIKKCDENGLISNIACLFDADVSNQFCDLNSLTDYMTKMRKRIDHSVNNSLLKDEKPDIDNLLAWHVSVWHT